MKEEKKETFSFEEAYVRLEEILEKLNGGEIPLEQSLTLYEEADRLIVLCHQKLTMAEQKIQTLIKNRNGEISINEKGEAESKDFHPNEEAVLSRNVDTSL